MPPGIGYGLPTPVYDQDTILRTSRAREAERRRGQGMGAPNAGPQLPAGRTQVAAAPAPATPPAQPPGGALSQALAAPPPMTAPFPLNAAALGRMEQGHQNPIGPAAAPPVAQALGAGQQAPPGYSEVLAMGEYGSPGGAFAVPIQPGRMTGREFEQQLTGGQLMNPASINAADLGRWLSAGAGIPGQTQAQRQEILDRLMGITTQGAQAAERLGGLGIRGAEVFGANGQPGSLQTRANEDRRAEGDFRGRLGLLIEQMGQGSRVRGAVNDFLRANPAATPQQVQAHLMGLRQTVPEMFNSPEADQVADFLRGWATTPFGTGPVAAAPQLGPPPSAAGPSPAPGGSSPGNNPVAPLPAYSGIQSLLDQHAGVARDQRGVAPQRTSNDVGQFLWRLDQSNPGFVRQNFPAIRQYIMDVWGPTGFERAAAGTDSRGQTPAGEYFTDYLPGVGLAVRAMGGVGGLFGGPSEEIRGRSALQQLLAGQGENFQNRFWW